MIRIFIATGRAFQLLEKDGNSWRSSTSLDGLGIQALGLDPSNSKVIYAASANKGLWKSIDGGQNWHDLKLPLSGVFSVAVSAADGALYAGTEPSALFKSMDGGEKWQEMKNLKSIPSAPSWSFPPRPHTSHVRWIAPNPHLADLILVGIELGGVMRSQDGGHSWQDHRPGAKLDAHELAWHPQEKGRAYQAAGDGVAWSSDYGESWRSASSRKDRTYTWALAVHPEKANTYFVSAAPGPYAAHYEDGQADAKVYRWRGKGPWEALDQLNKSRTVMPYSMQMHKGHLYVGFADGEIWHSPDEGDRWKKLRLGSAQPNKIIQMRLVD